MTSSVAPREERHSYGIGILIVAQLFFTVLDSSAKWLAVAGIPLNEIVFMRYATHVVLILVIFGPILGKGLFRTANWKVEVIRGICLLGTTAANFLAMRYLPLTVTAALIFTMPLMICALSVPMLGESVGPRRWIAIGVGMIGVLIIVRPGTEAFHPAALISLFAALLGALYSIFTRKLAGVDTAATQQFYSGTIALTLTTPIAFTGWTWPSDPTTWIVLFGFGVVGMIAHQLMTVAHRFATPAVLAPFTYLGLIYFAFVSWLIFAEPPDASFYLGAPIIIGSGLYIWLRERNQKSAVAVTPISD